MGNTLSLSSTAELILTGLVIAGGVVYYTYVHPAAGSPAAQASASLKAKKGKKKVAGGAKATGDESGVRTPIVVGFPTVLPGQFDADSAVSDAAPALSTSQTSSLAKKSKKKKGSKSATPTPAPADEPVSSAESETQQPLASTKGKKAKAKQAGKEKPKEQTLRPSPSIDTGTDGSWTRVGRRGTETGDSSPTAERTDDDRVTAAVENRRTFAEKMLPKPRKTAVDDMIETPNYPAISRVMRVQPRADEKPASGFSWGDYEDVAVASTSNAPVASSAPTAAVDESAEGEGETDENDGWGVVKGRGRPKPASQLSSTPSAASSQTLTAGDSKRARQNAAKRDAAKAAKAAAEAERLATLARHKRELERTKMAEQYNTGSGKGRGKVSGGMKAAVDSNGKLVWE
ncbi:hypothetical protein HWV62_28082 [Athelia sp. TMB]|nr:hypothetical protein HWV62_28082 [Athelia sp. TMB]